MDIAIAGNGTAGGGFAAFIPLLTMFLIFLLLFIFAIRQSLGGKKKHLEKISFTFLEKFLSDDETIQLTASGLSPVSALEKIFTGLIVFEIKKSLFVFTNKRIFHIPARKDFSYRKSIAQIPYADCNSIKIKRRYLIAEYKDGKKEKFYIVRHCRREIKEFLGTISYEGSYSSAKKRTHLCPHCTAELKEGKYICERCHLEFKDVDAATKYSIIYPGGGYFYTRHPFLGILDAFVEISLIVLIIKSLINTIDGVEGGQANLLFFGVILVFEKIITIYHSKHFIREYIPKEKESKPTAKSIG